jgi:hypothetical protein
MSAAEDRLARVESLLAYRALHGGPCEWGCDDEVRAALDGATSGGGMLGVQMGRRGVMHALSGRNTKGNALTLCGLTIDHTNPRYVEVKPERVPIGRHCLRCWS